MDNAHNKSSLSSEVQTKCLILAALTSTHAYNPFALYPLHLKHRAQLLFAKWPTSLAPITSLSFSKIFIHPTPIFPF